MVDLVLAAALGVSLGVVTFAATSFDNLLILMGFSADPRYPTGLVRPAYVGTVVAVALAAVALAAAARLVPDRHLGLLGLVPIGLGVFQLLRLAVWKLRGRPGRRAEDELARTLRLRRGRAAVVAVTLASSGDSLAAYAALFADTATRLVPWSVAGIGLGAGVWTCLASRLSGHETVRRGLERVGPVLLPALLIGIGLYILGDTPTDVIPGS